MRTLFFLLVLANVAFFAWSRFAGAPDAGSDPLPMVRQIEPEKLKIISPADLPAAPVAQKPAPPPPAPPPIACLEWGSFSVADAPRAEKALEPLALGARLAARREETTSWWVFIPPQGSRQDALKRTAELKALGVNDYFIVQEEGDLRWAVSLGVFRSVEAAQARLAALRAQGVRSAEVGPRETVVARIWYQVTSVDAPLQARLRDLARELEGSELKECP
jgi:SPOR domain